jgi:hypothetical protein
MTNTTPPTVRRRPDADRNEQRALAAMFCWNMALEAETKRRRAIDVGDLKNYARLQYGDK